MLFGFIVVRVLMPLVKGFGRLPPATSRTFAEILNAGTRPFHLINYLGALPGGTVLSSRIVGRLMDSTIGHLRGRLARESEHTLELAMHFPVGWDPYFKEVMTVGDVYHYPTQHSEHHRRQLTSGHLTVCRPPGLKQRVERCRVWTASLPAASTAVATRACIDYFQY